MNESETLFNEAIKDRGGIVKQRPQFREVFKERIDWVLEGYKSYSKLLKPFPSIIYDFVDNQHFSAFATKYHDTYIIGISVGALQIVEDLFLRMLADPRILPHIGNPKNESPDTGDLGNYYTNIEELVHRGHKGKYLARVPRDNVRKKMAYNLTFNCIELLFQHELSHILFGHVDYVFERNRRKISSYQELFQLNLDRQTMEVQADITATIRLGNLEVLTLRNPHKDVAELYTDEVSCLNLLYFSIYNLIRIQGDGNYKDTQPGKNYYPDPRLRQLIAGHYFKDIIKKNELKITDDEMWRGIALNLLHSENAYEIITGNKSNHEVFEPKYFWNNPLHKAIHDNWNKLRKEIMPYSYKPVLEW